MKVLPIRERLTKDTLHQLYINERKTTREIASLCKCSRNTLKSLMAEYGVNTRKPEESRKTIDKSLTKEILYNLYIEQEYDMPTIAHMFSCSTTSVFHLLAKYEIPKRSKSEAKILHYAKEPNVNLDFFRRLTPEFAYFLGLWISDGWVNTQGTIGIAIADKDVVVWVAETIGLLNDVSIRYSRTGTPMYWITFSNPVVREILFQYGIIPNKTLTVKIPELPPALYCHFIRGVFDGDGGINIKPRHNDPQIQFASGSYDFLQGLKHIIECNLGGDRKIFSSPAGNSYKYYIGGKQNVLNFGKWIYVDDSFGMRRKKDKFRDVGLQISTQ